MPLSFRTLAILAAAICLALAAVLLFAPRLLLSLWDVQYTYPVGLVARRAAALFLGIGVMLFLARNAEPSVSRLALSRGLAVGCLALAVLGCMEFFTGHAGIGILSAVLVEVVLACGLLVTARKQ
jgi:thiamine transporter ThiT